MARYLRRKLWRQGENEEEEKKDEVESGKVTDGGVVITTRIKRPREF